MYISFLEKIEGTRMVEIKESEKFWESKGAFSHKEISPEIAKKIKSNETLLHINLPKDFKTLNKDSTKYERYYLKFLFGNKLICHMQLDLSNISDRFPHGEIIRNLSIQIDLSTTKIEKINTDTTRIYNFNYQEKEKIKDLAIMSMFLVEKFDQGEIKGEETKFEVEKNCTIFPHKNHDKIVIEKFSEVLDYFEEEETEGRKKLTSDDRPPLILKEGIVEIKDFDTLYFNFDSDKYYLINEKGHVINSGAYSDKYEIRNQILLIFEYLNKKFLLDQDDNQENNKEKIEGKIKKIEKKQGKQKRNRNNKSKNNNNSNNNSSNKGKKSRKIIEIKNGNYYSKVKEEGKRDYQRKTKRWTRRGHWRRYRDDEGNVYKKIWIEPTVCIAQEGSDEVRKIYKV